MITDPPRISFVTMVFTIPRGPIDSRECSSLTTSTETMERSSEQTSQEAQVSTPPLNFLLIHEGPYALTGARIMTPYPHSKGLAAIVDMGNDFPCSIRDQLETLQCSIIFRETPERKTTRGYNTYGPGEFRGTHTHTHNFIETFHTNQ